MATERQKAVLEIEAAVKGAKSVEDLRGKVVELGGDASEVEDRAEGLSSALEELETKAAALSEYDRLAERAESAARGFESASERAGVLAEKQQRLVSSVAAVREALDRAAEAQSQYAADLARAQTEQKIAAENFDRLKQAAKEAGKSDEAAARAASEAKEKRDQASASVTRLTAALTGATKNVRSFDSQLKSNEKALSSIRKQTEAQASASANLANRLAEASDAEIEAAAAAEKLGINTANLVEEQSRLEDAAREAQNGLDLLKGELTDQIAVLERDRAAVKALDDAFAALGQKSPRSLRAAATAAQDAFNRIKAAGASAQSLDDAFERMARAALAAAKAEGRVGLEARAAALTVQAATAQQTASVNRLRSEFGLVGAAAKTGGATAARALNQVGGEAEGAAADLKKLSAEAGNTNREFLSLASPLRINQLAALAKGISNQVGDVTRLADAYNSLQSRIKLVAGEGADYAAISERIFEIANSTQQPLEAIGTLYTRTADALRQVGISTDETLNFTETLAQSFRISGASATEASAAIIQLSQGLSSGVLRGDEFNSVAEQSPRILQALTKSLGVTRGELRELAEQGQLTAEKITGALLSQAPEIAAEYAQLPKTIGGAVTQLQNELQRYVGETGNALGATDALAKIIQVLAENVGALDQVLAVAAAGGMVKFTLAAQAKANAALQAAAASRKAAIEAQALGAAAGGATPQVAGLASALGSLSNVLNLALSAFTGFQIGSYLHDEFEEARIAGTFLAEGFTQLAEAAKFAFDVITSPLDAAQDIEDYAEKLKLIHAEYSQIRADATDAARAQFEAGEKGAAAAEKPQQPLNDLDQILRQVTGAAVELAKELEGLSGEKLSSSIGQLQADLLNATNLVKQFEDQFAAISDAEFPVFEAANREAFDNATRRVEDLQDAIEVLSNERLRRLGVDAGEVLTGIDVEARKLLGTFRDLVRDPSSDPRLIKAAFEEVFERLDSPAELIELQRILKDDVRLAGLLGAEGAQAISDKLVEAERQADKTATALSDAFAAFGISAADEITKAAEESKIQFELIKASGQATANGLARAFEQYARAQLDAAEISGDIAVRGRLAGLEAEAQTDAQRIALERLTQEYGRTAEAAGAAGSSAAGGHRTAADAAIEQAEAVDFLSDAYERQRRAQIAASSLKDSTDRVTNLEGASISQASFDGRTATAFGTRGVREFQFIVQAIAGAIDRGEELLTRMRSLRVSRDGDVGKASALINAANGLANRLKDAAGPDGQQAQSLAKALRDAAIQLDQDLDNYIADASERDASSGGSAALAEASPANSNASSSVSGASSGALAARTPTSGSANASGVGSDARLTFALQSIADGLNRLNNANGRLVRVVFVSPQGAEFQAFGNGDQLESFLNGLEDAKAVSSL